MSAIFILTLQESAGEERFYGPDGRQTPYMMEAQRFTMMPSAGRGAFFAIEPPLPGETWEHWAPLFLDPVLTEAPEIPEPTVGAVGRRAVPRSVRQRVWLAIGAIALGLGVLGCASAGQPATAADQWFPIPYLIKNHAAGTEPDFTPPVAR